MALDLHPFQIERLMSNLSVILSANIGAKPVEILFDMDPSIPQTLIGDAMRLQQVLINLAGNAIKFTAQGEVLVRVRVSQRMAHQVVLHVAVRDAGIGIASQNQAHIFDGFSQAEASTTRRFGGTGLGLAICKRLVELMGGHLMLESELGQGSTFYFEVPFAIPEQQAESSQPAGSSDSQPFHALVLADNPAALTMLVRMVHSLGWSAHAVASGAEAIALTESQVARGAFPYQTVFVDCQLPGLDGWQTALRIRQLRGGRSVPIVVMVTAQGQDILAKQKQDGESSPIGFVVKPVTASILKDAVAGAQAEPMPAPGASEGRPGRHLRNPHWIGAGHAAHHRHDGQCHGLGPGRLPGRRNERPYWQTIQCATPDCNLAAAYGSIGTACAASPVQPSVLRAVGGAAPTTV